MKIAKIIFSILGMIFGVFMFVYGEYDDSPGGQLLGLVLFVFSIIILIKSRKESTA